MRNSGAICNFHPTRLTRLVNYSRLNWLTSVLCRARLNLTIRTVLMDHFTPHRGASAYLYPHPNLLSRGANDLLRTAIIRVLSFKKKISQCILLFRGVERNNDAYSQGKIRMTQREKGNNKFIKIPRTHKTEIRTVKQI